MSHRLQPQPDTKPNHHANIQAVLFDFDGTIFDTETREFRHWQELYRRHGLELSLKDWQQGVGTWDAFDPWLGLPADVQAAKDEVHAELRQRILDDLETQELRPNVRKVLEEVKTSGLRLALVTSSGRDWVLPWLKKHDLRGFFEFLMTRDDVSRVKPDPELYTKAVQKLGIEAGHCLAIEDSLHGATAAHAAGARVLVVPNEITGTQPFPADWPRANGFHGGLEHLLQVVHMAERQN